MASLFAKRVASDLLSVRSVASCSRFFSTKGYQYVQRDYEGECILKCDDKHGSSFIRGVVNDAFSPDFTPIGNLRRLLSAADDRIGFQKWTHMLPRWIVLENDSALCLFRNMTREYGRCVEDYVPKKEVISRPHEVDVSVRERDLSLILDLMRGLKSEPSDYYFDQMQEAEEVDSFVESMKESSIGIGPPGTVNVNVNVCVHVLLNHPQAAYIIVGLGAQGIGSPYGGYAYEMFLEESFYSILDVKTGHMSGIWTIIIPKKKGEDIQTLGGNLIFFRERKICKPTLWRPA